MNGAAAGGGYELAVSADHIMLIDDRRSSVALPETPLLAVLPGTGGLTRVTDKRKVRRDLADVFCSTEEGVRGRRAVEWRLVDEAVPPSAWEKRVGERAREFAARSDRPKDAQGVALTPLDRRFEGDDAVLYSSVRVEFDRGAGRATLTVLGAAGRAARLARGGEGRRLLAARAWRGSWTTRSSTSAPTSPSSACSRCAPRATRLPVLAHDAFLEQHKADWFIREVRHNLKRVLKRLDVTSRSMVALIEPGSCFAGTLGGARLRRGPLGHVHRRARGRQPHARRAHPFGHEFRRLPDGERPDAAGDALLRRAGEPRRAPKARIGEALEAEEAEELGLVTFAYDETDWDDELRIMLEERASFSPDALTGMEANLRFVGPETMETRIFGRLTAWQNWIFQRPNAVGEQGALKLYGSGVKPSFDKQRV